MVSLKNSIAQLRLTGRQLRGYFVMPVTDRQTLPQRWLAHTRLSSWPLASLVAGLVPYLLLMVLGVLDDPRVWLTDDWWSYGFLYPLVTLYLLFLIPIFRRLLNAALEVFIPLLPVTETREHAITGLDTLNRRQEWLAFGSGLVAGWLITPFEDFSNHWQVAYGLFGEGLNIGLIGWLMYYLLTGTRLLATLHNQTQGLNIPKPGLLTPLRQWSLAIGLAFLGGILLSFAFIPDKNLLSPRNIVIYCGFNLLILLVFLRADVSASLTGQFRILRAFALFILVALLGTLGYHYLEGWNTLDGFYMTVITMTTIGYGEILPLSQPGRIFTILLIFVSVGIAGYAISVVAAFIVEGDFHRILHRQKMDKHIARLNNHIILCGAGRIGTQIAIEFHKTQTPFVLIEENQEVLDEILRLGDIPYLRGDATKDETLYLAGIERARGLVATLSDDKENAFIVLSARSLNSRLRIVTRLTHEENAAKLRKVGADEIVSPNIIGGLRMASVMIRPSVVTFLDEMIRSTGQTLRLEETTIGERSELIGQTLAAANVGRRTGLLVVAIKSGQGKYQFNPRGEAILNEGDILIVMGTPEQLVALRQLC
jgi:voltage-gated potassium channel